ncbi:DUF3445 domain-containing protein [Conexibacter sp. DBS9H8]|uniref:heme-dependent oxidative N-demethylase family protein n=1 Tax=Conexibacter sp. DBS9H8 TaxID=2937801 RepID=UPI00200EC04E|nr:DUF3445 domain-containing protein [Conexibacter sp. DBS9H8]
MSSPPVIPDRVARFPFPFPEAHYRYSTNVEPARTPVRTAAGEWGRWLIDADDGYRDELALRAQILAADPSRMVSAPHMADAAWDTLLLCLGELAAAHPEEMVLHRDGAVYRWCNRRLDEERHFRRGDADSLGADPLAYAGSQVQEDIVLLEQREGELWAEAGLVTFAADWSLAFDIGMTFLEIHGPVPRVHVEGVIPRAHAFLLRLQPDAPYRRTNWTMSADPRLDQSTETYPEWGPARERALVDPAAVGQLQLRVEVQHLIRLPTSGAILFLIRTHLLSLEALMTVPEWARRFAEVLRELPADIADYKGVAGLRAPVLGWLEHPGPGAASRERQSRSAARSPT